MNGGEENGKRRIKLFCPSVSKIIQIIAADEQRLDLGSIARAFGLDPTTLKLNGHFISRGVDLVASSVTWKSLIGFFSARGLSTGATDSDALVVDGKLSKIGSKRSRGVEDSGNGILDDSRKGCLRGNKRPQNERCKLFNHELSIIGCVDSTSKTTGPKGLGLKRKWFSEDECLAKRTKSDEDVSHKLQTFCSQDRKCNALNSILSCSFISKTMKRMRGECNEMVATSTIKRSKIIEPMLSV